MLTHPENRYQVTDKLPAVTTLLSKVCSAVLQTHNYMHWLKSIGKSNLNTLRCSSGCSRCSC